MMRPRHFTAFARRPGFWVIASSMAVAIAANMATDRGLLPNGFSFADEGKASPGSGQVQREGSLLPDLVGSFRKAADRIQFVERGDASRNFLCLENLMLQRALQVMNDESTEIAWIVSGRVTEYLGANYLLIETLKRTK
jgi:hypothetical protein